MADITPQLLALQLVSGIGLGAIYALLAVGLSLIFGMLTVVNFAHGAFFMVGAFLGVYFQVLTGSFVVSLVLTPLVVGTIGLLSERFLVCPTEHGFGPGIPIGDLTGGVHHDHGIERRIEDDAHACFTGAHGQVLRLNLREHVIEGIGEQAHFIFAPFYCPHGIILLVGDRSGSFGQGQDGL